KNKKVMNHKGTKDTKGRTKKNGFSSAGSDSRRKGFQPDGYVISRRDGKFSLCGSPRKEKFLPLCPLCLRG
ncbi:MAG: hypothetical protein ACQEQX_11840, partial [Thermodesulfobacteriota bacterium]